MKFERINRLFYGLMAVAGIVASGASLRAADVPQNSTAPVTMTVTANVASSKRMPQINREDVIVRQGKSRLEVADWVPARGNRAGLELFILIDESADARVSLQYDDLREFINAQPASTQVGIGYMRNGTVQIAQDLTPNQSAVFRFYSAWEKTDPRFVDKDYFVRFLKNEADRFSTPIQLTW